ncbi:DUF3047 domain-containing protein [Planktotalea sp.]|uniref:DUF3047 domain-containing protein n=1 Tax=Planktotalea sp. TaxID=2029877 RepID=UPI0032974248
MTRIITLALIASLFAAPAVHAGQISFSKSWKEQKFSLFSKNKYSFKGSTLGVASNGSVSMAYRAVPEDLWSSSKATWRWAVDQSVPATDLRKKGGDDRNLAMYAVFLPEAEAQSLKGANIRKLLSSDAARVLVYVWGGNNGRGKVLDSPYLGSRGKTIVLRDAGTGSHSETVDFAADYKRAFGGAKGAFVGIAVSADSDDTDTSVKGTISNLTVN